jgi:vacuolar protein sorting-associated protein 18
VCLCVQDLLPLLPDFTEIDFFKEEICKSLEDCSGSIGNIKMEMQQLADDVDNTVNVWLCSTCGVVCLFVERLFFSLALCPHKQELENMKHRAYSVAYSSQKCELCAQELRTNQFYLFPCAHGFHSHCLVQSCAQSLPPAQRQELQRIQDSLSTLFRQGTQDARIKANQQELLQQQLESLIAADCPLCGYAIINKLTQSLLDETSGEEKSSWML